MHPSEQSTANPGASSVSYLQRKLQSLSDAVELSLLLAQLQQGGLEDSDFLASLQHYAPVESLALSTFPSEEGEPVTCWRWAANQAPEKSKLNLDVASYQALCQTPRQIDNALEELAPNEMELGSSFWQEGSQSVLLLPMVVAGSIQGVLHATSSQTAAFQEDHHSIFEMVASSLGSLTGFLHLEDSNHKLAQQQVELANVKADTKNEIDSLRTQLEEAMQQNESLSQKLAALQSERTQVSQELLHYRQERSKILDFSEQYQAAKQETFATGEEIRQFLMSVYEDANHLQQKAMGLFEENESMLHTHAELVMDAASEMIPQARSLSGNLESLEDPAFGKLPGRQMRFVRASVKAGRYINRILTQLNDYSRGQTSQIELSPELLPLASIFEETQGLYLSHINNKRQDIKVNWSNDLPQFVGDAYCTRQLIQSLFEHAVDATPADGAVLFEFQPSEEGGVQIKLTHDSEAISEEEMEKIFQPFQRPDFDPDDDIPPGLSLALARQYTRVQQGNISAEQNNGKMFFVVQLPANVSPVVPPATSTELSVKGFILPAIPENFNAPFGDNLQFPEFPPLEEFSGSSAELNAEDILESDLSLPSVVEEEEEVEAAEATVLPPPPPSLEPSPEPSDELIVPIEEVELTDEDLIEVAPESPVMPPPLPTQAPPLPSQMEENIQSVASVVDVSDFLDPEAPTSHAMVPDLPPMPPAMEPPQPPAAFQPPPLPPTPEPEPEPESSDSMDTLGLVLEELPPESGESHESLIIEELEPQEESNTLSEQSHLPETISTPTLLCLAGENEEPQDMIFEDFEEGGFQLALAPMEPNILDGVPSDQRPTVLLLYSNQSNTNYQNIISHMWSHPNTTTMPMLTSLVGDEAEKKFQLFWNQHQTQAQPESFWRQWLQRLSQYQSGSEYKVLSIGENPDSIDTYPLLQFLAGPRLHIKSELNPAKGVQLLWEAPPDLLSIHFTPENLNQWLPMFDEMSRSGRTIEIPMLLFSKQPLNQDIQNALTPLNFLYFQPAS